MSDDVRKVTILSQYFHPESISTGQLLTELGQAMAARGMDVDALCGQPTYYDTNRVPSRIEFGGMTIRRVNNTQLSKNSRIGKILNSTSFALGVFWRMLFAPRDRLLLIVTNPPFLAWIGWCMRRLRGQRFAYLIHDVYPDIAIKLGYMREGSLVSRLWERLNRRTYRAADTVIVLGRDMRDVLAAKGVPQEKIRIVENWTDGSLVRPTPRAENPFAKEHGLLDKFVVMYSGNMGLFHDMESIVEAADRLREHADIRFVFIGGGGKLDMMQRYAEEHELPNALFLPYQDKEMLRYTLPTADVALISLSEGCEGLAVPSKLYGTLAAGTPIVANLEPSGEVAQVIEEAECGRVVPVHRPDSIAEAILAYRDDPALTRRHGENARREFEQRYTIERIVAKFEEVLR
ncbi:MAG: glycosyltransferase family 4 protein [bacterium]|nr:glycosyltransferase family 4 protein [bacterium]